MRLACKMEDLGRREVCKWVGTLVTGPKWHHEVSARNGK